MHAVPGGTIDDQATRFARRSAELARKAKLHRIVLALKKSPEYIAPVHNYLEDLGACMAAPVQRADLAGEVVQRAMGTPHFEPQQPSGRRRSATNAFASDECRPWACNKAEQLRCAHAGEGAGQKQPQGVQVAIVRLDVLGRLIRRGAKSSSQSQLLEILEFMTSFSPETSILPEHQQLGGFMQLVADANERLGRRAAALTFPVDWHVSGVYALIGLDQAFKSSSRRLGGAFCS